ncbi:unnamed protein product [Cylindrotheca closterium]|uniref:CRAL-TRIO domain-containing protein n=1 Tax=Cylindrotheca closterium TaxID=2856 RepID=A0AAD2G5Y8_9STRA|nr:unnamed protein product [Cylindrotheca closterium]
MNQNRSSSSPSSRLSSCNLLGRPKPTSQSSTLPITTCRHTRQEMKEAEDILASELTKLSLQERTEALHDIHCVGQDLKETPELVQELLAQFDQTVKQQQQHEQTYEMIEKSHQRAYIEDPSFRLKFLRSNKHNVDKAVSQMLHFLRNKIKYFGNGCIGREITFDDLNEEDRELLLSGIYHIQKDKDQSGRSVMYMLTELIGGDREESLCRVAYYVYFNILISIFEVQMKGLVFVFYDISKADELPVIPGLNLTMAIMDMITSLPIRFTAVHFCLKARPEKLDLFNSLFKLVFKLSSHDCKVRSRLHYGSDIELQYQLRSHGINTDSSPIDAEGSLREDNRNDWLHEHLDTERRSAIRSNPSGKKTPFVEPDVNAVTSYDSLISGSEATSFETLHHSVVQGAEESHVSNAAHGPTSESRVSSVVAGAHEKQQKSESNIENAPVTPTDGDIFLGRGHLIRCNPGNIRFRKLVAKYKGEYDIAPRRRRKEIISEVCSVLTSEGERFLKQIDTGVWVNCSDHEIQKKISMLFREFRKTK